MTSASLVHGSYLFSGYEEEMASAKSGLLRFRVILRLRNAHSAVNPAYCRLNQGVKANTLCS